MAYMNEHEFKRVFHTKHNCKVNLHFFPNSRFSVLFFYHFLMISLLRKNYYVIGMFMFLFQKNQTMINKPKTSDKKDSEKYVFAGVQKYNSHPHLNDFPH